MGPHVKSSRKSRHFAAPNMNLGKGRLGPVRVQDGGRRVAIDTSPTAQIDADELIRALARYCAEIFFDEQLSTRPASNDS